MRLRPADVRPRHPSTGALRPSGVAAAMITAGAVFGIGMLVLPTNEPEPLPPPVMAPAPPPAPPPPPPPAPVTTLTTDGPVADAASAQVAATTAPTGVDATAAPPPAPQPAPPVKEAATPRREPEAEPAPSAAAAPKPDEPAPHEKLTDKDVAREAWRKNLPDISPEAGKATMLIPIKGSIEGATYHLTVKPRSVLVTMPKAESMITMPFYNVRHDGFRQLWIKKDDASGVTTMRIVLGEAVEPQVDIKDDFVRVTIRRPVDEAAPVAIPPSPAPTPTSTSTSTSTTPAPAPAPAEAPAPTPTPTPAPAPTHD